MNIDNAMNVLFEAKGVFRKRGFITFIEFMKSLDNDTIKVMSVDDMYSLGFKYYSKILKPKKILKICKCDFSNSRYIKDLLRFYYKGSISEDELNLKYVRIKNSNAAYFIIDDDVSFIFIKNDNESSDDILCHETIHYIQDMTGLEVGVLKKYLSDFYDEKNTKFIPIEVLAELKQLETFEMIQRETSPYMFNDKEIIPYLNMLCYFFESLGMKGKAPIKKVNELILEMNRLKQIRSNRIAFDFIDYMENDEVWKELFKDEQRLNLVAILFICLFYNQHRTVLKKIVGNYFNEEQ